MLLESRARQTPGALALLAPQRPPMTYGQLWTQCQYVRQWLADRGLFGKRVAVYLQQDVTLNGAILALITGCTCVPMRPQSTRDEVLRLLQRVRPHALLVAADAIGTMAGCARQLLIPVFRVRTDPASPAGTFVLEDEATTPGKPPAAAGSTLASAAYILETSGTTGLPKLAVLSHLNILWAAWQQVQRFGLTAEDRVLNFMPLHHNNAIQSMLVSLVAGGEIACMPGFDPWQMPFWLKEFRPTWFQSAPAMFAHLLDAIEASPEAGRLRDYSRLRLVRLSAAPVSPQLMQRGTEVLGARMLQQYGMTEVPLISIYDLSDPPSGSVGWPTGTEVQIRDEQGGACPSGASGMIWVRGPAVSAGYLSPDGTLDNQADAAGWFRTGDLGYLDPQGKVHLVGRSSEFISVGGEKVNPLEVEEAIRLHSAVRDAAVFPSPHPHLGQSVAAAVVLRAGCEVSAAQLRDYLLDRLSFHKVPRRVYFVSAVPLGPTGKVQRQQLHALICEQRLAESATTDLRKQSAGDSILRHLCQRVLRAPELAMNTDFVAAGADSLDLLALQTSASRELGVEIPIDILVRHSSVAQLGEWMKTQAMTIGANALRLNSATEGPAVFCLPPISGVPLRYLLLVKHLRLPMQFWGLLPPGVRVSVTKLARHYCQSICSMQPQGRLLLLGYSFGGLVGIEVARQLQVMGRHVACLALIDTRGPFLPSRGYSVRTMAMTLLQRPSGSLRPLLDRAAEWTNVVLRRRCARTGDFGAAVEMPEDLKAAIEHNRVARLRHRVRRWNGTPILIRATRQPPEFNDPTHGWSRVTRGVHVLPVDADHKTLMSEPAVGDVANALRPLLCAAAGV